MTEQLPTPEDGRDDAQDTVTENVEELLDTDRELTPPEQNRLRTLAATGWSYITERLQHRARDAYSSTEPGEFAECVFEHMGVTDRANMITADVFECPKCGRLLKDRHNTASSSILLERRRLRDLWVDVEVAEDGPAREHALADFRSALGLGRQPFDTGEQS
jgi:hypothetical protein